MRRKASSTPASLQKGRRSSVIVGKIADEVEKIKKFLREIYPLLSKKKYDKTEVMRIVDGFRDDGDAPNSRKRYIHTLMSFPDNVIEKYIANYINRDRKSGLTPYKSLLLFTNKPEIQQLRLTRVDDTIGTIGPIKMGWVLVEEVKRDFAGLKKGMIVEKKIKVVYRHESPEKGVYYLDDEGEEVNKKLVKFKQFNYN